jgi:hypothetical protein
MKFPTLEPSTKSQKVRYVLWILSIPLSLVVTGALVATLSRFSAIENGEFGFVIGFLIALVMLVVVPLALEMVWLISVRKQNATQVVLRGFFGSALQFGMMAIVTLSTAVSPEMLFLWALQLLLVAGFAIYRRFKLIEKTSAQIERR